MGLVTGVLVMGWVTGWDWVAGVMGWVMGWVTAVLVMGWVTGLELEKPVAPGQLARRWPHMWLTGCHSGSRL
jgi:hypothetical protein